MVDADMETAKKEAHMNSYNQFELGCSTLESWVVKDRASLARCDGCKMDYRASRRLADILVFKIGLEEILEKS